MAAWAAVAAIVTQAISGVYHSVRRGLSAPKLLKVSALTNEHAAVTTTSPAPTTAPMGGKMAPNDGYAAKLT